MSDSQISKEFKVSLKLYNLCKDVLIIKQCPLCNSPLVQNRALFCQYDNFKIDHEFMQLPVNNMSYDFPIIKPEEYSFLIQESLNGFISFGDLVSDQNIDNITILTLYNALIKYLIFK